MKLPKWVEEMKDDWSTWDDKGETFTEPMQPDIQKLIKALSIALEALENQTKYLYYEPEATKKAKEALRRIEEIGK